MEKITKVPKLRFQGFTDPWTELELKDAAEINPAGETLPEEFIYIDLESVNSGLLSAKKRISRKEAPSRAQRLLKKGDILFQMVRPYQRNNYFFDIPESDYVASTGYAQIRTAHSSQFLYHLFHTDKFVNKVILRCTGTSYPAINSDSLATIKIGIPKLREQQKIASFLSSVDTKIQQLTKKKELLEQYKKGVMQKIFKQEIRFKDENGKSYPKWSTIKAKDLFQSVTNKNHNGDLPILAATQERGVVYRDTIGIEIQSSEASVKSYKIVEPGDFVISLRSFQGGIEFSDVKGICSPAYTILKPKSKIDNQFFKYYFKKEDFIKRLSETVIGIRDGKQISYEAFGGMKLFFPDVNEQRKVSTFLSEIDKKISVLESQLEKTKQFKKGLLQQMLV